MCTTFRWYREDKEKFCSAHSLLQDLCWVTAAFGQLLVHHRSIIHLKSPVTLHYTLSLRVGNIHCLHAEVLEVQLRANMALSQMTGKHSVKDENAPSSVEQSHDHIYARQI